MDSKTLADKVFLPAILGIFGLGVSFIGDMSHSIREMSVSVQELNIKMSRVDETVRDHETRLRTVERYRK